MTIEQLITSAQRTLQIEPTSFKAKKLIDNITQFFYIGSL